MDQLLLVFELFIFEYRSRLLDHTVLLLLEVKRGKEGASRASYE